MTKISNNLGDAKTLITHPATTTHAKLTAAAQAELGLTPASLRISIGLEEADDLISDFQQALRKYKSAHILFGIAGERTANGAGNDA